MVYSDIKGICPEKRRDAGTRDDGSAFDGWKQCFSGSVVWKRSDDYETPNAGLGDDAVPGGVFRNPPS